MGSFVHYAEQKKPACELETCLLEYVQLRGALVAIINIDIVVAVHSGR
ncbi:MAG: hypothetical protein P1V18_04350 [Candidatus Gracilibacteria bacterium]|nr:hypothetical protein [Candidatus Gracilibacteria bacterium]